MSNKSKVVDLYSGVGGLSLGASRADFEVACAVELEQRIADSHARNFPYSKHICGDVASLSGTYLLEKVQLKHSELAGIIGGPPCQGFSAIGKRNPADARNKLFADYFRLVMEVRPAFFMAENVPGILNVKYDELRKDALKVAEGAYDILTPIIVKASDFGAATIRTRVFFIGVRKDVSGAERIPAAINAAKTGSSTYVNEALTGMPLKVSDDWINFNDSWQRIEFEDKNEYLDSLNEVMDGIGDSESLIKFIKKKEVSGCFGTKHSAEVALRYARLKPGQQDKISKSVKLKSDGFCPTLRAGTDNTKGSFQAVRPIHHLEPRVITPREAARLQGFPDWFQFHETKWHTFRQIGNSVCPIAAQKVLKAVKTTLSL